MSVVLECFKGLSMTGLEHILTWNIVLGSPLSFFFLGSGFTFHWERYLGKNRIEIVQ